MCRPDAEAVKTVWRSIARRSGTGHRAASRSQPGRPGATGQPGRLRTPRRPGRGGADGDPHAHRRGSGRAPQPTAAARRQRHARRDGTEHDPLGVPGPRVGPGPRHRPRLGARPPRRRRSHWSSHPPTGVGRFMFADGDEPPLRAALRSDGLVNDLQRDPAWSAARPATGAGVPGSGFIRRGQRVTSPSQGGALRGPGGVKWRRDGPSWAGLGHSGQTGADRH